jgi:uncharacterized damage-inducible protein DinB
MNSSIAGLFLDYSMRKLRDMTACVETCLASLSEEQVWERHAAHENTIGNLMLHLCGNMRQWIMHGVAEQTDVRKRDAEFSVASGLSKTELLALFQSTIAEAVAVLEALPHERLLERTDPQQRGEVFVLDAIYQVVGHVQQHTGQIILLTKQMCQRDLDLTIPRPR